MAFNGWMLPDTERARVLEAFPPKYPCAKASHVTHALDDKTIPADAEVVIVGHADDGQGMEALVCMVDGDIHRPDGGIYHLTLSHTKNRGAKEANAVVAEGWEGVTPMEVDARGFMSKGSTYVTTPLSRIPK